MGLSERESETVSDADASTASAARRREIMLAEAGALSPGNVRVVRRIGRWPVSARAWKARHERRLPRRAPRPRGAHSTTGWTTPSARRTTRSRSTSWAATRAADGCEG